MTDKEFTNMNLKTCEECKSEFYPNTSQMRELCPECSSILYGYKNCDHQFENGRCIKCYWNENRSDYIQELLNKKQG